MNLSYHYLTVAHVSDGRQCQDGDIPMSKRLAAALKVFFDDGSDPD
jgi:hypothetical protein